MAALAVEAGFPPGVLSVLSGYGPTAGQAIILHKDILKVSFTGSGRTGRKLLEGCAASNLKKVSLELGGKSPSIVFDDCDLDKAVFWTQSGIFNHNGQICVASSRIYVQETIAEKFLAKFKEMTEKEKPGSQWDDSTKHGPVVDELQYKNILSYIEVGKKEATLVTGGNTAGSKGYYIEPTVFANVKEDSKIMREEVG